MPGSIDPHMASRHIVRTIRPFEHHRLVCDVSKREAMTMGVSAFRCVIRMRIATQDSASLDDNAMK